MGSFRRTLCRMLGCQKETPKTQAEMLPSDVRSESHGLANDLMRLDAHIRDLETANRNIREWAQAMRGDGR